MRLALLAFLTCAPLAAWADRPILEKSCLVLAVCAEAPDLLRPEVVTFLDGAMAGFASRVEGNAVLTHYNRLYDACSENMTLSISEAMTVASQD